LQQLWKPQPQADGSVSRLWQRFRKWLWIGLALGYDVPIIRRITPVLAEPAPPYSSIPSDDLSSVVVLTNLMGASPEKFVDKIAALYIPGLTAGN
jgi:hypothetical protein